MQNFTVSHYEVVEKIGAGGMGVVYRGRDLLLDRPVALKFLAPGLAGSVRAFQQLEHEARAIASLSHPNIATLYEIATFKNTPVLVLEYFPGGTLRARMAARPLEPQEIMDYANQIAEGLGYAHQRDLVHRDVKPENMLFTVDGRLKISDFGLARMGDENDITADEKIEGTLRYVSPECLRGLVPDRRSDIFSFGVILYEMAAGEHPFQGKTAAAILQNIIHSQIPPLAALRQDLPKSLDRVIRHATAKDLRMRYSCMEDLIRDLRHPEPWSHTSQDASGTTTILLIEDDDSLRGVLELGLQDQGFRVLKTGDGIEGLCLAGAELPHLVLLDLGLPGRSGLDVCRDLRLQGFEAPIVMVTGKVEEIDRVVGLEIGADDYVTKPFSQRELVARIRAHLRRRCA